MGIEQEEKPVLRLASASPRRRQLLELIGVPHVVAPADIDEAPHEREPAAVYVCRLAREKVAAIWALNRDLPVLGADTTVVIGGEILGKPESLADARRMLGLLSGRTHEVHTGLALRSAAGVLCACSTTAVSFAELTPAQIDTYWASAEPQGKAGAYAIQGLGAVFVKHIAGSYSGVMGLPLYETAEMLKQAGIPVWARATGGAK